MELDYRTGIYVDDIEKTADKYKANVYGVAAKTITSFKLLDAYPFIMDKEGKIIIHPIYENGVELSPEKHLVAIDKKDNKNNLGKKAWKLIIQSPARGIDCIRR